MPHIPHYTREQDQLVLEKSENLEKGVVSVVTTPEMRFYSNLFLVPKKDGGQRPDINLKALNQFVWTQHGRDSHFKRDCET